MVKFVQLFVRYFANRWTIKHCLWAIIKRTWLSSCFKDQTIIKWSTSFSRHPKTQKSCSWSENVKIRTSPWSCPSDPSSLAASRLTDPAPVPSLWAQDFPLPPVGFPDWRRLLLLLPSPSRAPVSASSRVYLRSSVRPLPVSTSLLPERDTVQTRLLLLLLSHCN